MDIKIIFIIGFCFDILQVNAQNYITIKQTFSISSNGNIDDLIIEGFLPKDFEGRQKVINIDFSGGMVVKNRGKNSDYFIYRIRNQKHAFNKEITITFTIQTYNRDFNTILKSGIIATDSKLNIDNRYLKRQQYQPVNSKVIQQVASQFNASTDSAKVHQIFNYVLDQLHYNDEILEDLGARYALKKGIGDCTEYSDLMVTLCKASNLPARVISGAVAGSGSNINHNWVEVFIKPYGWISFDPSLADQQHALSSFPSLHKDYIYYNLDRIDRKLGSSMWRYSWNGDGNAFVSVKCHYTFLHHYK